MKSNVNWNEWNWIELWNDWLMVRWIARNAQEWVTEGRMDIELRCISIKANFHAIILTQIRFRWLTVGLGGAGWVYYIIELNYAQGLDLCVCCKSINQSNNRAINHTVGSTNNGKYKKERKEWKTWFFSSFNFICGLRQMPVSCCSSNCCCFCCICQLLLLIRLMLLLLLLSCCRLMQFLINHCQLQLR